VEERGGSLGETACGRRAGAGHASKQFKVQPGVANSGNKAGLRRSAGACDWGLRTHGNMAELGQLLLGAPLQGLHTISREGHQRHLSQSESGGCMGVSMGTWLLWEEARKMDDHKKEGPARCHRQSPHLCTAARQEVGRQPQSPQLPHTVLCAASFSALRRQVQRARQRQRRSSKRSVT